MGTIDFILPPVLAFVLGLAFTPLVRGIAVRWKICEKPNGMTSRDIAHIGGVAIIGGMLFALIPAFLFLLPGGPLHRAVVPILVASGFLTFFLGIIDDLRSLHYMYKLFFQIVVSIYVSAGGLVLLEHFGIIDISLPMDLAAFGIAAAWMLAITTSFNLIDGIDGLSSGLGLISAAAFATAGHLFGQPLVVTLSLVLAGVVLAFLRFNFPPAKILMGDSGSLFLGLIFGQVNQDHVDRLILLENRRPLLVEDLVALRVRYARDEPHQELIGHVGVGVGRLAFRTVADGPKAIQGTD